MATTQPADTPSPTAPVADNPNAASSDPAPVPGPNHNLAAPEQAAMPETEPAPVPVAAIIPAPPPEDEPAPAPAPEIPPVVDDALHKVATVPPHLRFILEPGRNLLEARVERRYLRELLQHFAPSLVIRADTTKRTLIALFHQIIIAEYGLWFGHFD